MAKQLISPTLSKSLVNPSTALSPHPPPQGSSQNTAHRVGCAILPPSSSKHALGQPDTCVTSLCAWDSSRLFLISHHPELGQEKFANQKCHCHESSQAGEVPHHRNVFIGGRNKLSCFLFSHLESQSWPCWGPLSSRECAAGVAARQQQCRHTWKPQPRAGNPQGRTIQHLFVQSHPNSAKGYSEDGNWGCRQGGSLSQGQTSLTKVLGVEVNPHPQRNPHEVSLLCFPAKVPELTLPSRRGKADEKAAQKQGNFFLCGVWMESWQKAFIRYLLEPCYLLFPSIYLCRRRFTAHTGKTPWFLGPAL